jgi:hypothetical protein
VSDLPDQLKGFLVALRADLVEKRLLPIIALLVVAVVAIPVAFTATASKAPAVSTPPTPVTPSGPGAALAAAPPRQQASTRPLGHLRDPFLVHGRPPTSIGTSTSPITARPPTGATGPSGITIPPRAPSSGTTGPGGATGTKPGNSLKPPLNPISKLELAVYSVDYSFGQGANMKIISNGLRLDAMPANTAPVVQYLGVTKDAASAAFLVWGPATASGDGICIDGQTPCQVVELKPGDTEFIDVLVPGAGLVQFEVDMLAIHSKQAATQAEALKAHLLQSADGVKALSLSNATALAKLEYSTVYGTLLPRPTQTSGTQQAGSTRAQANTTRAHADSTSHPARALGSHRVHHHAHHGRRR